MYTVVMAGGAVTLTASIGFIGYLVSRDRESQLGPATRTSVSLGFITTFVMTMIVAGYVGDKQALTSVRMHQVTLPFLLLVGQEPSAIYDQHIFFHYMACNYYRW